jgi:hypothetical protein
MPFTDYLSTAVGNWLRGTAMPTAPTGLVVALYTTAPTRAGGGVKVSGGSYADQAFTLAAASGSPPTFASAAQVNFPAPTADWGDVIARAVLDATSGQMYDFYVFPSAVTVHTGDTVKFNAGGITIQIGV